MHDQEMLERPGVLKRLKTGKLANADRGYINKEYVKQVAWTNPHDSKEVNNLKSRIRLRHETFNGKMSFFGCLNQTWRHTTEQHLIAFRTVDVTIQYAMNEGTSILFQP
ncbi:hypothetical protein ACA910_012153 [Epithemia clementina (nom. ined.)]